MPADGGGIAGMPGTGLGVDPRSPMARYRGHPASSTIRGLSESGNLEIAATAGLETGATAFRGYTLAGDDFAEVGDAGEAAQDFVDQAEVCAADFLVGIEDHHLVEEGIDHRAQRGDQSERLAVGALLA